MNDHFAICVRCGQAKGLPWETCSRCGLNPELDEETLVRSVYLSTGRYDDERRQRRYREELKGYAARIERGEAIEYDPAEMQRLREQKAAVEAFSPARALFRIFLPGLLFLGALLVIWLALRALRS